MNITTNSNRTTGAKGLALALRASAVFGLSAIGLVLTGAVGSHDANRTHAQPTAGRLERAAPQGQDVYYIVDSQEAADRVAMAESVTAQERVLVGIPMPERIVHIIDDTDAGHITAEEAMLVAQ